MIRLLAPRCTTGHPIALCGACPNGMGQKDHATLGSGAGGEKEGPAITLEELPLEARVRIEVGTESLFMAVAWVFRDACFTRSILLQAKTLCWSARSSAGGAPTPPEFAVSLLLESGLTDATANGAV
ncbi:hypothetical protein Q7P37_010038 [Cladosporium fusiforme]